MVVVNMKFSLYFFIASILRNLAYLFGFIKIKLDHLYKICIINGIDSIDCCVETKKEMYNTMFPKK